MSKIHIADLKEFCHRVLCATGMESSDAEMASAVLSETDAYGFYSHGSKNLLGYIQKAEAGGIDLCGQFEVLTEGPSYALADAHNALGMVTSCKAMHLACDKAESAGISIVSVRNSCHFGAAGYYVNMAAQRGMIGIAMSNVDPNMTIPGAKGMVIGNDPIAYAAPAMGEPSVFLDIALSRVASLKVIQARRDGRSIPADWIVDKDGQPTTDPSHYPEEGAMQPMADHKGYGIAVLVELLTGILSGGPTSASGDIVSWCFEPEKRNNVSHVFIAVNPTLFHTDQPISQRVEELIQALHAAPRAVDSERIFVPGEMEWEKYRKAAEEGIDLPEDVASSLRDLSEKTKVPLPLFE